VKCINFDVRGRSVFLDLLVDGIPNLVGGDLAVEEVGERSQAAFCDFLAVHQLVSHTAEALGDDVSAFSRVCLVFPVDEDLLNSLGDLDDVLGDFDGRPFNNLDKEVEEDREFISQSVTCKGCEDNFDQGADIDGGLAGLVHLPEHVVNGLANGLVIVLFFLEGSMVDRREESTLDLLVHDVGNSQLRLYEGKAKVLVTFRFLHFRWLVVVEGCNTIVDQLSQVKHVLGFFRANFVLVFSNDPRSVDNLEIQSFLFVGGESELLITVVRKVGSGKDHAGGSHLCSMDTFLE